MAALGLMAAAQADGLRVPEELSIVGFDDLPMAAWTRPGLTTVRQPIAEKGRLAAQLVISFLEGRQPASPPPLQTSLVVRGSTASPGEVSVTGKTEIAESKVKANNEQTAEADSPPGAGG